MGEPSEKYNRLMASLDHPVVVQVGRKEGRKNGSRPRKKVLYDLTRLPADTKECIRGFLKTRKGTDQAKADNYLSIFPSLLDFLGPFHLQDLDQEKVQAWLESKKSWNQNTKHFRWYNSLKLVLEWFYSERGGNMPKWVRFFEVEKGEPRVTQQKVLNREEVMQLAAHALTPRLRAIILCTFETNARRSELFELKIEDLEMHDNYARAFIPLKKTREKGREREALFIQSFPALAEWVRCHWTGEGYLFIRDKGKEHSAYDNINESLKRTARRAGIKKPISLHRLRHSGVTDDLKKGLSSIEVARKNGYAQGSVMVEKVYSHLSSSDVSEKELILAGIRPAEKEKLNLLSCPRCRTPNNKTEIVCWRCAEPLTEEGKLIAMQQRNDELGLMHARMDQNILEMRELKEKFSEISERVLLSVPELKNRKQYREVERKVLEVRKG